jgi:endonuclease/exonuclease/phosphatase family metal-dependent hydrolase
VEIRSSASDAHLARPATSRKSSVVTSLRAVASSLLVGLLVALACALSACTVPTPLTPREADPGSVHYTVQTYNIHRYRSGDAPTQAAIGAANADIACLQEVTNAWAEIIGEKYKTQYPYMLFAPKDDAGGLAVLSKFPLTDRGVMLVPGDLHPGWLVEVDAPGGRIQILHVHLRALFEGWKDPVRNYFNSGDDHVIEMSMFMGNVREELPMLVVGDFNEGVKGKTVRKLESEGYRNALPLFRPGQYTWHAPSVGNALDMTIDHIMFDDHFEPLSSWVENRGHSDHLPVLAHLEVVPRPAALESAQQVGETPLEGAKTAPVVPSAPSAPSR